MKHIFLSVYVSAMLGVAQAGANEIPNSTPATSSHNGGQPSTVAGAEANSSCGNENGHVDDFSARHAVLNDRTGRDGAIDCLSGASNAYGGELNTNDPVAGNSHGSVEPVPEYRTYAMLAVGLGLLGLGARSRRNNPFD